MMWEGLALTRSAFPMQVKAGEKKKKNIQLCQDWRDKWKGTRVQLGQHRIQDEPKNHDCFSPPSTALQLCLHHKGVKQLLSQVWSVSGVSSSFLQYCWLIISDSTSIFAAGLGVMIRFREWKHCALISCCLWEEGSA